MKVMSTLRGFWNKAKVCFYSTSAMAMLAFTELAHGEGVGAVSYTHLTLPTNREV